MVVRDTAALDLQVVVGSMTVLAAVSVAVHVSVASEAPNSIDLDLEVLVEILPVEVAGVFAR